MEAGVRRHLKYPSDIKTHPVIETMALHNMSTVDSIKNAIIGVENLMDGFIRPRLHGSGILEPDGGILVEMVNNEGHDFPAMLLGALCGYSSGDVAFEMTVEQIDIAIGAMAPAEDCTDFQHPNIAAWRRIAARLREDKNARAIAVFSSNEEPIGQNRFIDAFAEALENSDF